MSMATIFASVKANPNTTRGWVFTAHTAAACLLMSAGCAQESTGW